MFYIVCVILVVVYFGEYILIWIEMVDLEMVDLIN